MVDNRGAGERAVLVYRIRRILREVVQFLAVVVLITPAYLYVFRSIREGGSSGSVGRLAKKISGIYGGNLCRRFTIEGVRFANSDRIREYVERYCFRGDLGLADLKLALLEDPWISRLYIQKTIPDALKVVVIEHNPFAVFTSDYKNYILVNELGERIYIPDEEIANFSSLFLIVDNVFNPTEMGKMFNILSNYANVARKVSTLVRMRNRRWNLRLRNNVLVKMPEDSECTTKTWTMLSDLLEVYGLDIDLEEIDFRIDRKVFLKYKTGTREKIDQFSKIHSR
ncbi:MAG: cell division protein FtsQ/DivIB [Rickettsiales bacterium]|jgi:hypothetical protein|nr:cell division protein FtsQ/DivIB [Rickettsiales bacterium]